MKSRYTPGFAQSTRDTPETMKDSIRSKLDMMSARYKSVGLQLGTSEVISDQNKYRELSKEYAQLEPVVQCYERYREAYDGVVSAKAMLEEDDREMAELAKEELAELTPQLEQIEQELQILLLPKDPDDTRNIYLEVRAGTGGDEASIFAGDLFRMYSRYAEHQGWKVEVVSQSEGDHGGYKEIISRIIGKDVFGRLKFESGAHRVQRVPETESQGRIHTSACTVAVMPEVETVEEIDINPADIKMDTYRSSGAGGQHVNTTDSAVRLTHIPTGIVVECQDERSQHKNRAKAMSLIGSRILDHERRKVQSEQAATRRQLVGTGDRSERIRTYNFPQGRVTDHRINLTLYKLDSVMEGELNELLDALLSEHQADLLASVGEEA